MTGWIILIVILAVMILLSLIRLGGRVKYGADGLSLVLIAGPARIQLLPAKPKEKKEPKKKKGKPKIAEEHGKGQKKGTIGRVLQLLPVVAEAAGGLKRRIRIDRLMLSVIWAAEDAASAAIGYGKANAVMGMIWPLLDNNFKVKDCNFHVDVDYNKTEPDFSADAAITITVGQLLSFVVHYGVKLLKIWIRSGKRSEEEQEAKQ